MLKKLKHLCFDKDGVLIDVHAYWRYNTELRANFIKKKYKLNSDDCDLIIDKMGINLSIGKIKKNGPVGYKPRNIVIEKVIKTLIELSINVEFGDIEKIFFQVDKNQQKNNDYKIILLDGVKEFLQKVNEKFILTIFTSDRKNNAVIALNNFGIKKYFDLIIGGDNVQNQKPNPDGILKACSMIKMEPSETAYISDTYSDLEMAKSANVLYKFGALTGLGSEKELNKISDLVFNNFSELLYHINNAKL